MKISEKAASPNWFVITETQLFNTYFEEHAVILGFSNYQLGSSDITYVHLRLFF